MDTAISGNTSNSMVEPVDQAVIELASLPSVHVSNERQHLLDVGHEEDHNQSSDPSLIGHKKRPQDYDNGSVRLSTFRTWWQEMILSLYAIGLFIAIIAILTVFNKRTQPDWSLGLNLSTVIAFLATFMRSGLVMVIEEVLGQAKWTWHQRPRPLLHLAYFDEATRGPLGSLLLWFKVTSRADISSASGHTVAALVASFVAVLSLAIGSFTQQAIRTVPCTMQASNSSVTLPLALNWPKSLLSRTGAAHYDLDSTTKAAIFQAVAGASPERDTLLQGCPTGNCTFDELMPGMSYRTMGFCSKCLDTTSMLIEEYEVHNNTDPLPRTGFWPTILRLPNGLQIGPTGSVDSTETVFRAAPDNTTWLAPILGIDTRDSKGWNISVATISILSLTDVGCKLERSNHRDSYKCSYPRLNMNESIAGNDGWNAVSATCAVYPCVQDMTAKVNNGRLEETVTQEVPLNNMRHDGDTTGMWLFPCFIDGVRYDEHNITLAPWNNTRNNQSDIPPEIPDQCIQRMTWGLYKFFDDGFLYDLLNGTCGMMINQGNDLLVRSWPLCREKYWLSGLYNRGNATFESISRVMNNVATAVTDRYRLTSLTDYGMTNLNTVNGTVWETTICTQFVWPWLLFPAALVALTIVSCILIMISTASSADRPPVWKSSILPLLYLQDTPRLSELEGYHASQMKRAAKSVSVELKRDEELRWRLVPVGNMKAET